MKEPQEDGVLLITGASGFIGQHLLSVVQNHRVRLLGRSEYARPSGRAKEKHRLGEALNRFPTDHKDFSLKGEVDESEGKLVAPNFMFHQAEFDGGTDYAEALKGVSVVIHLAAISSVSRNPTEKEVSELWRINVQAVENLARQAATAGVKRFIFLSSAKVLGEDTKPNAPFTSDSPVSPKDFYARSKAEAEAALIKICNSSQMEFVIIRPPLVYGPGVKGNMAALARLATAVRVLPFGSLSKNRRSLLSVSNLVDVISLSIDEPEAANQVLLLADTRAVSTKELLLCLARGGGVRIVFLPMPQTAIYIAARFFNRPSLARRLCGSLELDCSATYSKLGISPAQSVEDGLEQLGAWYVNGEYARPSVRPTLALLRVCDICLAAIGLALTLPLMLIVALVGYFDTGSPLFRQRRVGRQQIPFTLLKFRTMKLGTASVATHLAKPEAITPFGRFLRRSKLDELPQLWNVLCGQMSLVGPRPCLYSQSELIHEREIRGVNRVRPGITGLAQVSGIDMSQPRRLAEVDAEMLRDLGLGKYCLYILLTVSGKGAGDRVPLEARSMPREEINQVINE